jgi:cellulose synthase (UDP-forming)
MSSVDEVYNPMHKFFVSQQTSEEVDISKRPPAVQVALPVTPVPASSTVEFEPLALDERSMAIQVALPVTPLPELLPLSEQQAKKSYFVDVMSAKQKLQYRLLVSIWLVTLILFWTWWLQKGHIVTFSGLLINSLMLLWSTILPAYYFYFVGRMRKPNPHLDLPSGKVAIIVTRAPSEPWTVVNKTLEAMKVQDFPSAFDVWLADEDPSEGTLQWCTDQHVMVSCRKGAAGYHNKQWPRREKCKEGNLAYFYDHWGYQLYDFVVQLDADHVPETGYLRAMVGPFIDPAVGYVAAPSICDANIRESWTVRARLYCEASLHGSLQAGYNDGFAPLCIGSHYAVRTGALQQAGGLGPELAEDHSTTLMLNAAGWKGVFAFDAIAHGEGAGSLADSVTQEFQWSRSLMRILLTLTPRYWTKLAVSLKFQFLFAQLWYPLFAGYMLLAYAFPLVALIAKTPWVNVNYVQFLEYSVSPTIGCLLIVVWVRAQGWFRPADAKVVSWETVIFQFLRWPWVLYGVVDAFISVLLKKELSFKVTPKGAPGIKPLPNKVLFPYTLIVVITATMAIAVSNAGSASGYYYFALVNSLLYFVVLCAIILLHFWENRASSHSNITKYLDGPLMQLFFASFFMATEVFVHGQEALRIFSIQ